METVDETEVIVFEYNEDGLRTKKTVTVGNTTTVTEYVLHGKNVVHLTRGTDVLHFYYDAQGKPSIIVFNGTAYGYLYNLQGDVVALVDGTGAKVVEYGYDAWGKPTGKTGSLAGTLGTLQPFRYRGYVFDEETGDYYLRSRYYRAEWGRFVSADEVIKYNVYCYTNNMPVQFADYDGHDAMIIKDRVAIRSHPLRLNKYVLDRVDKGTHCFVEYQIERLNDEKGVYETWYYVSFENSKIHNGYVISDCLSLTDLDQEMLNSTPRVSMMNDGFLHVGDTGPQVYYLQRLLCEHGFLSGRGCCDGLYGRATETAVSDFQYAFNMEYHFDDYDGNKIPETGVYGEYTYNALQYCEKYGWPSPQQP